MAVQSVSCSSERDGWFSFLGLRGGNEKRDVCLMRYGKPHCAALLARGKTAEIVSATTLVDGGRLHVVNGFTCRVSDGAGRLFLDEWCGLSDGVRGMRGDDRKIGREYMEAWSGFFLLAHQTKISRAVSSSRSRNAIVVALEIPAQRATLALLVQE